jgi:hypothetical protein
MELYYFPNKWFRLNTLRSHSSVLLKPVALGGSDRYEFDYSRLGEHLCRDNLLLQQRQRLRF